MVCQITIDDNNIITGWSIGGYIPNGIDVPEIPQEIIDSEDYSKWCYTEEKGFYENLDYKPPEPVPEITTEELALAVAELAETQAEDKIEIEMAIAELAEVILNG